VSDPADVAATGGPDGAGARPVGARPPAPESLSPSQLARRQRIVRGALSLLESGDYDTIQMRDVAVAADVALGTVYRYFTSKEHLFAAVLLEWAGGFARQVRQTPSAGADDAERLTAALLRAAAAFEHRPQFYRLITVLDVVTDPLVAGLYRQFAQGTQAALAETLHDVAPADVGAVMALATAVLDSSLRAWSLGRMAMPEVEWRLRRSVSLVFSAPPDRPPVRGDR
jgi:AcrR family transcriptional regulator